MAGALSSLFCGYILAKGYFAVASLWRYIKLPYPEEGIYFFFYCFPLKIPVTAKRQGGTIRGKGNRYKGGCVCVCLWLCWRLKVMQSHTEQRLGEGTEVTDH